VFRASHDQGAFGWKFALAVVDDQLAPVREAQGLRVAASTSFQSGAEAPAALIRLPLVLFRISSLVEGAGLDGHWIRLLLRRCWKECGAVGHKRHGIA
jgi:hypothetical protein